MTDLAAITGGAFSPEELAKLIGAMTPAELEQLQKLIAAAAAHPDTARARLLAACFEEQRDSVLDPSSLKVDFCTRRAAKTYSWGTEAVYDSFDWPRAKYLFLGMVREEARRIFWEDVLKDLDRRHQLGMKFNESRLEAKMPNGAMIYIGAADANEQEMRKLLGQKYRKIAIDEAQDWLQLLVTPEAPLPDLIYSVLKPACTEYKGSISLLGTPGKLLNSFFRKVTPVSVRAGMSGEKGEIGGWSIHCWDTTRNTSMAPTGKRVCERWREEITDLVATHPRIQETPAFRRNYLGEWVLDESMLVYRYRADRNAWDGKLPQHDAGRWHHVLGIDLGYNDASAFVVLAYHDHDLKLRVREVLKEKGLDISAVAIRAKAFIAKYAVEVTVVDGANKQAVMEMQNRHGLTLIPADKTGKEDFIELMNADFITGKILVDAATCSGLTEEYGSLVWDEKASPRKEHEACDNHAADAALYGWRFCYQFIAQEIEPPPAPGSAKAAEAEAKRLLDVARVQVEEAKAQHEEMFPQDWSSDWGA